MAKNAAGKKPHQAQNQKRDAHGHFIKSAAPKKTRPAAKTHQSKTQKRDYHGRFSPKAKPSQSQSSILDLNTTQSAQKPEAQPIGETVTIVGTSPNGQRRFFARFTQLKFHLPTLKGRPTHLVLVGLLALAAIGSTAGVYFWRQNQKLSSNPDKIAQENAKELVFKVGKLIELPQGEDPVVATVSDKDKLKNQSFFSKAENGDNVLIYSQSRKAILYRASTNRVIEVATLNINTGDQGQVSGEKTVPSPTPAAQESPTSQTKPASPSPKTSPSL